MHRKSIVTPAWIAAGVVVNTRHLESMIDTYRRRQAECTHQKRDPRGTCYECGHREAK